MTRIKIALPSLLAGVSLLWLIASLPFPEAPGFIQIRNLLVEYSGTLSMAAMSVAMILAMRMPWLNRWLDGLDKSYRLHKWLGITALVTSVTHWLAAQGPKWAASLGLLQGGRPPRPDVELTPVQQFFLSQRGAAEAIGEWAFYGAVLLIALALTHRFAYKYFVSTHKLIAVAYLALVWHAFILMDRAAWFQPVGIVTALLMTGGVISAVLTLLGLIGRKRQAGATIRDIRHFPGMRTTRIEVMMDEGWKGHEAGQFAFVTFDPREGKHPFTMSSAWDPQTRRLSFVTKALGDYTDDLPEGLKIGGRATVEGPYGRFTFDDGKDRQIWIGGGIGITPFIARMEYLTATPDGKQIDLIHTTPHIEPEVLELLTEDARAAGIKLHVLVDGDDGLLTAERLRRMLPDWKSASVWFCGPARFGQTIRRDLAARGHSARNFHQELFNMR